MHLKFWKVGVVLVTAPLVFGACHTDTQRGTIRNAAVSSRDSSRVLGPGDIRIVSRDTMIEIALIGDTVVTGLGAKARAKLRTETDTGAVTGTGLGAKLEKLVKSSVQSALNQEFTFPLSSIGDVRYEGAKLELFDSGGKSMAVFGGSSSDSSSGHATFSAADAQAFIAAYRAKKAKPM